MPSDFETQVPIASVDAKGVANLILDWADDEGREISNLKLQKLIFFAHSDFVKSTGQALVTEVFQAWDHGPVLPSLYREFRQNGAGPIRNRAMKFDPISAMTDIAHVCLSEIQSDHLRSSYSFYKHIGPFTLSGLSHADDGPWDRARALFDCGLNPDRQIGTALIRTYHQRIRD